jgi:hexokinase
MLIVPLLCCTQGITYPAASSSNGTSPAPSPRVSKPAPVVGFCFSFAVEQSALDNGKLMGWTKGFDVDGVIGKDVVKLLAGEQVLACLQRVELK